MQNTIVENIPIKELNLELLQPNTQTYKDPEQGGQKIIVIGKPGCFSLGTKILMYDGLVKPVEKINTGDKVMGWDSTPRNVLELCRENDIMYTINPLKWESYTVNSKHILVLRNKNNHIVEITVEDYLNKSQSWKDEFKLFKTSVEFTNVQEVQNCYNNGFKYSNFIKLPKEYIINTRQNRLDFLAGIIDSCLYSSNNETQFGYYIHCNKDLKNDILYLIRSLGFYAVYDNILSSVYISGKLSSIPTKLVQLQDTENILDSEFSVERLKYDNYYGFTLDGDHKFLLDTFDVVHNTGKTTLIASLLYAKKHIYPVAMAMSGTEDSNHFYRQIFPSTFVFNSYDEEQVTKFVKRQKIAKQHLDNPWAVLILDDCTDDPSLFKKPLQQGLYKRGRHWKMLYILSLQYGMDVRPVIRTNVDGVFILREPNLRNRKVMYENYAGIIPDFKLFCDILDQITDDYTALFINNATRSNDWKECVFWYKAKPIPRDFKFGSDDYWKFHYSRYNPEYVDPVIV
jgi:hypothetical protein